mmetsp:Transcript_95534/g.270242  ORF Transcript_95534/g.270242 Transcript_95534/m.270242 type:complete len:244 (+) Transcript_95534:662-1393(+)
MLHRDLTVIEHEGAVCGKGARNRPPSVNLLHHGHLARNVPITAHTIADVIWHRKAMVPRDAIPADRVCLAAHVLALVWHAGLIWHPVLRHVFVDHPSIPTVASRRRPRAVRGRDTIHDALAAQHNVWEAALAHDLDAVVQRGHCAMDPTCPAVLWDVLIPICGNKVHAIDVAPIERLGQRLHGDQRFRRHCTWHGFSGQVWTRAHIAMAVVRLCSRTVRREQNSEDQCEGHRRLRAGPGQKST